MNVEAALNRHHHQRQFLSSDWMAPQAGDNFNVLEDEREAKQIAAKRTQLLREQNVRTQRHITLDEIGRPIALGDFQELNIILKGMLTAR